MINISNQNKEFNLVIRLICIIAKVFDYNTLVQRCKNSSVKVANIKIKCLPSKDIKYNIWEGKISTPFFNVRDL